MEPIGPYHCAELVENEGGVDGICDVRVLSKEECKICLTSHIFLVRVADGTLVNLDELEGEVFIIVREV
jgi:hypothetical protein